MPPNTLPPHLVVASFAFPFAATVAATVVPAASIATGRNPATPKWGLVEKCLSQAYSTEGV